jgi:CHAT domain-containing protein
MGEIFIRYGANSALAPSKALRQGMLALLDKAKANTDRAYLAHPFAWAAFMLVGEGRRMAER